MKLTKRTRKLKTIRNENLVAGVVYGKLMESTPIEVDYKEFMKHYYKFGKSMTFEADFENEQHHVYIKEVQLDPLNHQNVLHFDLIKVSTTDTITADIPIYVTDKERLEEKGVIVQLITPTVSTEYAVGKGISRFEISVKELDVNDAVYVKDILVPEGLTILDDAEKMVINITEPQYDDSDFETPTADDDEMDVEVINQGDEEELEEDTEE